MNTHVLQFTLKEAELNESFLKTIKQFFSGKEIVLSIAEKVEPQTPPSAHLSAERTAVEEAAKGAPGSKGAGGGQPKKITIDFD